MNEKNGIKIFYNGTIYSKYVPLTTVDSLVTNGGKVEYCGTSKEAMELYAKKSDSIVNLEGKIVIPGFVDSHLHLDDLGGSINHLDLRGIDSIEAMKTRVNDYHLRNPDIRVIIGAGWDQESFSEGRWPNRWDLDEVESKVPVFLERYCEHAGVVNSRMLDLLESNNFPSPIFPRSTGGEFSGVVKEEAAWFFKEKALRLADDLEGNLISAASYLLSLGVTSVGFVSCGCNSVDFLSRNYSKLGIRVRAYLRSECADSIEDYRSKIGDNPYLQINGLKLFADGALGAGTAAMREPYEDEPENKGILYLDSERLTEIMREFNGKGVQFAIHAIGDRAIDAVIEAISRSDKNGLLEPRIEHCSILRHDHVEKLRKLGIGVTVQPAFVIDDWWVVRRLGKDRSKMSYPLATLHKNHVKLGISTDSPVEPPNPWFTIDAAVNRGEREMREILRHSANEKVDLPTALHLYTKGSASLLMSKEMGTLEVGSYADFAILNKDPFDAHDLRSIKVLETVVGGVTRFQAR